MSVFDAIVELKEYLASLEEKYKKFELPETEKRIRAVKLAIKCLQDTFRK